MICISTDKGISLYDGSSFNHLSLDNGLVDNEIFGTFEDSKGRLWLKTYNGEFCYYHKKKIYHNGNSSWLNTKPFSSYIHSIFEYQGSIWFISSKGEIQVLTENTFKTIALTKEEQKVNGVFELNNQLVVVITDLLGKPLRLISFDDKSSYEEVNLQTNKNNRFNNVCSSILDRYILLSFKNTTTDLADNNFFVVTLDNPEQKSIYLDEIKSQSINQLKTIDSSLFIATRNGLYQYKMLPNLTFKFVKHYLENNIVSNLTLDNEGYLWVSTLDAGVYRISYNSPFKQLLNTNVHFLGVDKLSNKLFIGSNSKYYKWENSTLYSFGLPTSTNENNEINLIKTIDKDGRLFISASTTSFIKTANEYYSTPSLSGVKSIFLEGDTLWVGRYKSIEAIHLKDLTQFNNKVFQLDRANNISVDQDYVYYANNKGIHLINRKTKHIHSINIKVNDFQKEEDTLWCATKSKGLLKITKNDTIFFNANNGLNGNNINHFYLDQSVIWIATNQGFSKLDRSTSTITNYDMTFGLPILGINKIACHKDVLFLGGNKGLFSIEINSLKKQNHHHPTIFIDDFIVNNVSVLNKSNLEFAHHENNITINFFSVAFSNANKLLFRYKVNNDDHWITTSSKNLNFPKLKPGSYYIQIQASSAYNEWGETTHTSFIIRPPFYQTGWFILSSVALFMLLSLLIIYFVINSIKKKEQTKRLISESEQKALRAQMNPHFLFNILNSIQQFFLKNESQKGHVYISKFAALIRRILDNSDQSYITIADEIATLQNYVELEKIRIARDFIFEIEIDQKLDTSKITIPTMILQPFLENALWHGIKHVSNPKITLKFNQKEEFLYVTISDNGRGYDVEKALNKNKPSGIKLSKERIDALNLSLSKKMKLSITSNTSGTIVELKKYLS